MIKLVGLPIMFQLKYVIHRGYLVAKLLLSFLESWEIFLNICCSFPVRLDLRSLRFLSEHKLPYVIFRWDECSLTNFWKDVSPKHSSSWTLNIKVERLRVEFAELGIYTQPFLTLFSITMVQAEVHSDIFSFVLVYSGDALCVVFFGHLAQAWVRVVQTPVVW